MKNKNIKFNVMSARSTMPGFSDLEKDLIGQVTTPIPKIPNFLFDMDETVYERSTGSKGKITKREEFDGRYMYVVEFTPSDVKALFEEDITRTAPNFLKQEEKTRRSRLGTVAFAVLSFLAAYVAILVGASYMQHGRGISIYGYDHELREMQIQQKKEIEKLQEEYLRDLEKRASYYKLAENEEGF